MEKRPPHHWLCKALVVGLYVAQLVATVSVAAPIIVPDKRNPGYYQPFRCLQFDRDSTSHGFIRNQCGHTVEGHWTNNKGEWGMWTIGAGANYPVFDGMSGQPVGCLPDDGYSKSLQLCKDTRYQPPASSAAQNQGTSDVARLRKELGLSNETSPSNQQRSGESDAARLARELGINPQNAPRETTAAELRDAMQKWDSEQERIRQENAAKEAQRQAYARQQEIDREKRAEILSEQMMATAREQQRETDELNDQRRQAAVAQQNTRKQNDDSWFSTLGTIAGAIAFGAATGKAGIDPGTAMLQYSAMQSKSGSRSSDGESCRSDPVMMSRVNAILESCTENQASGSCADARMMTSCWRRIESATASCPVAQNESREMVQRFAREEAEACR